MKKKHYRAIWLSDIHLGCKDCKADFLLHFLKKNKAPTIYLVGDIIDFWALSRKVHWPKSHNKVLNYLLKMSQKGVEVIYLPGNHDEIMKPYEDLLFASVQVQQEHIHETLNGKRILMLHGDKFDGLVCFGKFHAKLGDVLYDFLLFLNRVNHWTRQRFGLPYWSLATYIKTKVKKANEAIARYKNAAIDEAKRQGTDGIVCGHIHHPQLLIERDVIYCNDGDWIENCTCLVETEEGELQLLKWLDGQNDTQIISQIQA